MKVKVDKDKCSKCNKLSKVAENLNGIWVFRCKEKCKYIKGDN